MPDVIHTRIITFVKYKNSNPNGINIFYYIQSNEEIRREEKELICHCSADMKLMISPGIA